MDIKNILMSKHFIFITIILFLLTLIIVMKVKYYNKNDEQKMCE